MTSTTRLAAVLASLVVSAAASAQEEPRSAPRLGLGISAEASLVGSLVPLGNAVYAPPVQLHVPIAVTPAFRLEPSIGFVTVKDKGSESTPSTGPGAPALTSTSFSLGLGALYVRPVAPKVQAIAGGRITAIWSKDQTVASDPQRSVVEAKQQNLVVAAVLGGEYLPSPWFSVGLEGQLSFAALGDYETTASGTSTKNKGGSSASTHALLTVRVYFL
jgi:hypothetical protein